MPGRWRDSTRAARLPADWRQRCAAVKERDGYRCRWVEQGQRCTEAGDEVDHIERTAGDELHNLRSLCRYHHGIKSSAEGNAARWRYRQGRAAEQHPGLRP